MKVSVQCASSGSPEKAAAAIAAAAREAGEGSDAARLIRLGLKELARS
jgi:Holliday junction DNA helicase RuvA